MRFDTVDAVLRQSVAASPDRIALRSGGRQISYRTLDDRASRLAGALLGAGLDRGDRVAVWAGTSVAYVELYLAAAKSGLVVAPVNSRFRTAEGAHVIGDCLPAALVYDDDVAGHVADAVGQNDVRLLVALGETLLPGAVSIADLYEARPAPSVAIGEDDLWVLAYTSGTTGWPKAAAISHRAAVQGFRSGCHISRLPVFGQRLFTANMSFVGATIAGIFPALMARGTIHLESPADPEHLLALIEERRPQTAGLPNPWFSEFAELARRRPAAVESLSTIVQGGGRIDPGVARSLATSLGDRLVLSWGMTEHCGVPMAATLPGDWSNTGPRDVAQSVGVATVGVSLKVVDDDGRELDPDDGDSVGEVLVRSPILFSGYRRPDGEIVDPKVDGWFPTGDLGAIAAEGYVYLAERRSSLIVSGGMNVYPSEIERVVCELDAVREAAVVGTPHPRWGESPVAVVVAHEQRTVNERDVIEHCRHQLASYKKPTAVWFRGDLPRTTSGKIDLRVLRAEVARWLEATSGEPDSSEPAP